MRTWPATRVVVLVTAVLLATGCGAASVHSGSPTHPLRLRLVTSTAAGPCSLAPLATDGPGSACDRDAATTYVLGEALGTLTPLR